MNRFVTARRSAGALLVLALVGGAAPPTSAAGTGAPDQVSFADPVVLPWPDLSTMRSGQLDEDGKADLLVVTEGERRLTIMLGDGAGGFEPVDGGPQRAESWRWDYTLADLTGDGLADLVEIRSEPERLTVRPARPGPRFGHRTSYEMPEISLASVLVTTDLEGDGDLDVVVNARDTVSVLVNDGRGRLAHSDQVDGRWLVVQVADFDRDGIGDLVLGDGAQVAVALGQDDLTYAEPTVVQESRAVFTDLRAPDVDGDQDPDILLISPRLDRTVVHLGRGDGRFERKPVRGEVAGDLLPNWIDAADFDGDGFADLVAPLFEPGTSVLPGLGDGTFADSLDATGGFDDHGRRVIADLDGDGRPDLLVYDRNPGVLASAINTSAG